MNKEEEMEIENNDNKNLISKDKAKFIPIKDRLTSRFLTKYERAKIIGERAIQINNGSEVYVEIPNGVWDSLKIAEKELKEKKIPYVIRRYLPNGEFEDWELNELIFD
jgi:DNA-directed RNA polymerase I, II, and III subunit RPABC2